MLCCTSGEFCPSLGLDELWGFVHTKEQSLPYAKIYKETYGDAWVWNAFAPVWRLGTIPEIPKTQSLSCSLKHYGLSAQLPPAHFA
jgi:hypothetical protein